MGGHSPVSIVFLCAMSPVLIISCIACYFFFLLGIAWFTSRKAGSEAYFLGNKSSPWYAVAFGMIGDSLSGVTFISVPGAVLNSNFSYLQLVFGYFFGYFIIAQVLLPLFYKMNVTSIYSYLKERYGSITERTGSFFFILSRTLGAAARLYLAAGVLQVFVFNHYGIPFWISVTIIIFLILIYTFKGGIKTLVWTDTFQSAFLILGVLLSVWAIKEAMQTDWTGLVNLVNESPLSETFFWDWKERSFFPKQFLGGMFIAIVMTGLDQNMMQKNLSMRTFSEAQKNMRWFSLVLVLVNVFFLALGALLYIYSEKNGIALPVNESGKIISDDVFPLLALNHLGTLAGLAFIIGLTAATFSSADSVLTALTTSFYIDFLRLDKKENESSASKQKTRTTIHVVFAVILLMVILLFKALNNKAIIDTVLIVAGYTYGPLLGLYALGIFSKIKVHDKAIPFVCLLAPAVTYIINANSERLFSGYKIGHELLLINGLITIAGLLLFRKKAD